MLLAPGGREPEHLFSDRLTGSNAPTAVMGGRSQHSNADAYLPRRFMQGIFPTRWESDLINVANDQMAMTFPSPNHSFALAMTFTDGSRKYTASESLDRVQHT